MEIEGITEVVMETINVYEYNLSSFSSGGEI